MSVLPADLPPPDHHARRDALRERMETLEISALVVTARANVRYLSGFTGSNGQLLVTADGQDALFTDGRYMEQAADEAPDLELDRSRDWIAGAFARARDAGATRLGFEGSHVPFAEGTRLTAQGEAGGLPVRPTESVVEALRAVKDQHELALLRAACRVTADAFADLLTWAAPGLTEQQIATRLERTLADLGADGAAFPAIVATGANSARPHHRPTDRRAATGAVLKVDFGALVAGYHADMTRTIAFGEPPATLRAVHDAVRTAQAAGVDAALAGRAAGDVDAACRESLDAAGYGEHFVHGTGHGIGLDIHERPAVGPGGRATLAARMTLTVEPGVYLPGTGGVRIEDSLAIRTDGPPEVLTTSPRDLLVL